LVAGLEWLLLFAEPIPIDNNKAANASATSVNVFGVDSESPEPFEQQLDLLHRAPGFAALHLADMWRYFVKRLTAHDSMR